MTELLFFFIAIEFKVKPENGKKIIKLTNLSVVTCDH